MSRKPALLIPIVLIALVGCGGGGDGATGGASAPPAEKYAATGALLRDLNQGGVACTPGGQEKQAGPSGTVLSYSQICTSRDGGYSFTAVVYPGRLGPKLASESANYLADQLGTYGGVAVVLTGANWYLTSTEADSLNEAQAVLGGRLVEGSQ